MLSLPLHSRFGLSRTLLERQSRLSSRVLALPQGFDPLSERLGTFGKQPAREPRSLLGMRRLTAPDRRQDEFAPRSERLARRRQGLEHLQIVVVPEPVAQALQL